MTGRASREYVPGLVVALLLAPFVIKGGQLWPYQPHLADLDAYYYAVRGMLRGEFIYDVASPRMLLRFVYPPVAGVLMAPLAVGPYVFWQVAWTVLNVAAQVEVLKRCGVRRGWTLGLITAGLLIAMEPIRTTLGYGQVNTLLMMLVVIDLLPAPAGRERWWPQGLFIGLAAAIKLTPLLFVVFLVFIGRRTSALVAAASFSFWTLVGYYALPKESLFFWQSLSDGLNTPEGALYVGNQAISGAFARLISPEATQGATLMSGIVALLGVTVAAKWWQRHERVFAVGVVGLSLCLASPLSWTHHFVWALVLFASLAQTRLPEWIRLAMGVGVVWISFGAPLMLPYGLAQELTYTPTQQLIGSFTPVWGTAFIIALVFDELRRIAVPIRLPAPEATPA